MSAAGGVPCELNQFIDQTLELNSNDSTTTETVVNGGLHPNLVEPLPEVRCHYDVTKTTVSIQRKTFEFDEVWWSVPETQISEPPEGLAFASQEYIYNRLRPDVIPSIQNGYNCCIFAYGQTGSGKTHTMIGQRDDAALTGIIPRICSDLFALPGYRCRVTFVEIYNEKVYDLLRAPDFRVPTTGGTMFVTPLRCDGLRVRTHPVDGPYVEDANCFEVSTVKDVMDVIGWGLLYRTVSETKMNERSSRSHAILRLTMTHTSQHLQDGGKTLCSIRHSSMNLVDLAGSERVKNSGVSGAHLTETAFTNQSLSTLRKVIDSLVEDPQRKHVVPYRESTLTYILSGSLGGNCKTFMIATISPSMLHLSESISTLTYASKARRIKALVRSNEDETGRLIARLKQEMERAVQAQLVAQNQDEKNELESEIKALNTSMQDMVGREQDALAQVKITQEQLARTEDVLVTTNENLRETTITLNQLRDRSRREVHRYAQVRWRLVYSEVVRRKQQLLHHEEVRELKEQRDVEQHKVQELEKEVAELKEKYQTVCKKLESSPHINSNECKRLRATLDESRAAQAKLKQVYQDSLTRNSVSDTKLRSISHASAHYHDPLLNSTKKDSVTVDSPKGVQDTQTLLTGVEHKTAHLPVIQTHAENSRNLNSKSNPLQSESSAGKFSCDSNENTRQAQCSSEEREVSQSTPQDGASRRTFESLKTIIQRITSAVGIPSPKAIDDESELEEYITRLRQDLPQTSLREDFISKPNDFKDAAQLLLDTEPHLLRNLQVDLRSIPSPSQRTTLLRRFGRVVNGYATMHSSKPRYIEYIGLPIPQEDDPRALVGMIANLTHENEMLVDQLAQYGQCIGTHYVQSPPRVGRGEDAERRSPLQPPRNDDFVPHFSGLETPPRPEGMKSIETDIPLDHNENPTATIGQSHSQSGSTLPAPKTGIMSTITTRAPSSNFQWTVTPNRMRRALKNLVTGKYTAITDEMVCTIGRNECHTISLSDLVVSRTHAVIKCTCFPDPCILFDLNSPGGTFVNNVRVTGSRGHLLENGDVLSFGGMYRTKREPLSDTTSTKKVADSRSRTPSQHRSVNENDHASLGGKSRGDIAKGSAIRSRSWCSAERGVVPRVGTTVQLREGLTRLRATPNVTPATPPPVLTDDMNPFVVHAFVYIEDMASFRNSWSYRNETTRYSSAFMPWTVGQTDNTLAEAPSRTKSPSAKPPIPELPLSSLNKQSGTSVSKTAMSAAWNLGIKSLVRSATSTSTTATLSSVSKCGQPRSARGSRTASRSPLAITSAIHFVNPASQPNLRTTTKRVGDTQDLLHHADRVEETILPVRSTLPKSKAHQILRPTPKRRDAISGAGISKVSPYQSSRCSSSSSRVANDAERIQRNNVTGVASNRMGISGLSSTEMLSRTHTHTSPNDLIKNSKGGLSATVGLSHRKISPTQATKAPHNQTLYRVSKEALAKLQSQISSGKRLPTPVTDGAGSAPSKVLFDEQLEGNDPSSTLNANANLTSIRTHLPSKVASDRIYNSVIPQISAKSMVPRTKTPSPSPRLDVSTSPITYRHSQEVSKVSSTKSTKPAAIVTKISTSHRTKPSL